MQSYFWIQTVCLECPIKCLWGYFQPLRPVCGASNCSPHGIQLSRMWSVAVIHMCIFWGHVNAVGLHFVKIVPRKNVTCGVNVKLIGNVEPQLLVNDFIPCYLWPPIVMGRPLYFCPVVSSVFFYLFIFFPCLISAVADWMSTMLLHMVWP